MPRQTCLDHSVMLVKSARGRGYGRRCLGGVLLVAALLAGCADRNTRNDLAAMNTERLQIGSHTFVAWIADSPAEHELGLMQVSADELAPLSADPANGLPDGAYRGMLFVFDTEQPRSFWMYNTITALDIAYIRTDGTIVKTYTMAPLETRLYPSIEPMLYALEVSAGLFEQLGIRAGDKVELPAMLLKANP